MVDRKLAWTDCDPYFKKLHEAGVDLIVTGGQAINLWLHYFYEKTPNSTLTPIASKDIDVLGELRAAQECARILGGDFRPVNRSSTATALSAVLFIKDNSENPLRIDFQCDSSPNSADTISAAAVPIPTSWGHVRVMHPLHCLQTRIYNVLEIYLEGMRKYDTPHGLSQLRAAIQIQKMFIQELATTEAGPRKVLNNYEELFRFALSPHGLRIWAGHRIDVFDCVQVLEELPEAFVERRLPQMQRQLAAKRRESGQGS